MVRVLNFFCVALMGLSILALYHVSEKTRVAHMELTQTVRQIADDRKAISGCCKPNGSMSPHRNAFSNSPRPGLAWPTPLQYNSAHSNNCRAAAPIPRR